MEKLKQSYIGAAQVIGICARALGQKWSGTDLDNSMRRPFFGMQLAVDKLHANHLQTDAINAEISAAMAMVDEDALKEHFERVITMEERGVVSMEYTRKYYRLDKRGAK